MKKIRFTKIISYRSYFYIRYLHVLVQCTYMGLPLPYYYFHYRSMSNKIQIDTMRNVIKKHGTVFTIIFVSDVCFVCQNGNNMKRIFFLSFLIILTFSHTKKRTCIIILTYNYLSIILCWCSHICLDGYLYNAINFIFSCVGELSTWSFSLRSSIKLLLFNQIIRVQDDTKIFPMFHVFCLSPFQ